MSCQINRNSKGDINQVLASNGNPSELYQKLSEVLLPEEALVKYAETLTENFQQYMNDANLERDSNGELKDIKHIYSKKPNPFLAELSGESLFSRQQSVQSGIELDFLEEVKDDELVSLSYSIKVVKENLEKETDPVRKEKLIRRLAELTSRRKISQDAKEYSRTMVEFTEVINYLNLEVQEVREQFYELDFSTNPEGTPRGIKDLDLPEVVRLKNIIDYIVSINNITEEGPLFKREILENPVYLEMLNDTSLKAQQVAVALNKKWRNLVVSQANETIDNSDYSTTEGLLNRPSMDQDWGSMMFRDIRKYDDEYAQLMRRVVTKSEFDSLEEFFREQQKLEKLVADAAPFMNKDDMAFAQKDADGNLTDRMIHNYTFEQQELMEKQQDSLMSTSIKFSQDEKNQFREFLNGPDSLYIPIDVVMDGTDQEIEEMIQKFTPFVPRSQVEAAIKKMRSQEEIYLVQKQLLDEELDYLLANATDDMARMQLRGSYRLKQEELLNTTSPRAFEYFIEGRKMLPDADGAVTKEYTGALVPKFYIPTNESAYDKRFDKFRENEPLLKLWEYIVQRNRLVKQSLPFKKQGQIDENFLPALNNRVLSNFSFTRGGINKILPRLQSVYAKLVKDDNTVLDRLTGKPKAYVPAITFGRSEEAISKEAALRVIEAKKNGATPKSIKEYKKEIRNELAQERSWDIEAIMNLYNLQAITYSHKLRSQDLVRSIMGLSARRKIYEENRIGNILVANKKPQYKVGDTNVHKAVENYAYKTFFNLNTQKEFGNLAAILGNPKNVEAAKAQQVLDDPELKAKLSKEEILFLEEVVKTGKRTPFVSQIVRSVSALVHLRGLGWNFFSALSTVLYSSITNQIEAGRYYSEESFRVSMREALDSSVSFWSGNKIRSQAAEKMRNAMDWGDFMGDSTNELHERARETANMFGKVEQIKPYFLEKRSEYLGQAPVAIAMLRDAKVTLTKENGESTEVSLYECFDEKFRWIREEPMPNGQVAAIKDNIKDVIERFHGNYNPKAPILGKNNAIVQLALTFRTWLIEGIANRWEKEKFNGAIKGRWRSYGSFVKQQYQQNGPMSMLQMAGGLFLETARRMTNMYVSMATFGTVRRVAGRNDFSGYVGAGFTETDAKNMHANMKELIFLLNMVVMSYLLTAMLEGEDDETTAKTIRFMVNQLSRLETDASLYINPNEFEKLNKNVIPAFTAFSAFTDILSAVGKGVMEDNWHLEGGVYAGWNRPLKETLEFLPFTNQYMRFESTTRQLFDKN